MAQSRFTAAVIEIIRAIPRGKVFSYGRIAKLAGDSRGARQVVRILHACSDKEKLPWHRVISKDGRISLKPQHGYEKQRSMLEKEGVLFDGNGKVDLNHFLWQPEDDWSPEEGFDDF